MTGRAVFVNTDGGTLSYSTSGTSVGGGSVSVNAATGEFTYTPTQAQRQSATLSTTDRFTVTATNGSVTSSSTITVPVDPGTPVGTSAWVRTPDVRTGAVTGLSRATDGSGRTLTFSAPSTSAGGGAVSLNASTGEFTYTPTQAQRQSATLSTTDSFTVTISNGVRTTTQAVTVPVDPGTPVANTQWVRGTSSTNGRVTGTAKFVDGSGRTLTFTVPNTSAGGGAVTYTGSTGEFTYTPTQAQRQSAGLNTTDTFTVTADNGLRTTVRTVTVPVDPGTPVAGTPFVRNAGITTGLVTGLAKGTDSVGGPVTYSAPATSPGGGAVSINANTGEFSYTPTQAQRRSAGPSTTDTFTVTISNGARTTTQAVTVPVDPGTPVGTSAWVRTPDVRTGTVTGLARATDSVGGALGYSAPATSAGGGGVSINVNTGEFTYTPTQAQRQSAGVNTTDSFTVTISNGGRTITQAVTVPVDPGTPVANTPWVRGTNLTTGLVTGTAKFIDGSGRAVTYTVPATSAGGGAVGYNSGTGEFTYTPTAAQRQSAGLNTTDTFTVTANNGVRTTVQTVTVPVDPGTPVARTPWVRTASTGTGVVTGIAKGTDSVGGAVTYSVSGTSAGGGSVSVNAATGDFTYTPTQSQRQGAGPNTTDTFTVSISNGARTTTQAITVPVDPGTPVGTSAWVRTPDVRTGAVTGLARATDSVGGSLTFSAPSTSAGGGAVSVNSGTGEFTYTPTQAQRQSATLSTTDSFTVTISNGGRTITQAVTVPVDPGTAVANTQWVRGTNTYNGVVTGTAKFVDGSGRTLTYTVPNTSAGGGAVTYTGSTGEFTYTPTLSQRQSAGLNTTDTFTVTTNNGVRTVVRTVTVPVDPGTPIAKAPFVRAANGTTGVVTGVTKFVDTAGRSVTYSVGGSTSGGGTVSVHASTGDFIYTPTVDQRQNANQNTTDTFTVTASNGVRSATQTVSVPVDPNARPVISNLSLTPQSGGVVDGTISVTDADSDPVTLTVTSPTNGALTAFNSATGAFTFTPTAQARHNAAADNATNADRTSNFTITATDGRGGVTPLAVSINIDPVNSAPTGSFSIGNPDQVTGQATGSLSYTDADNDTLAYTATVAPTKGSVVFDQQGNFTYTPTPQARHNAAADGVGPQTDTFTLKVDDGHGGTVTTSAFTVSIVPFNAPLAQTATLGPSDPGTAAVQVSVADPDGDVPTYTIDSGPAKGTLTVNGGYLTYLPNRSISHGIAGGATPEDDSFTITADDGHGSTRQFAVTLTIGPANYSPAFAALSIGTPAAQTGQVTGSLTATDAVDNDPRTYTVTTGPANGGTASINASTGAFTYTPSSGGRQSAANAPTATGLFSGKWGQNQLVSVQRGACNQAGGLCQVSGFGQARIDTWGWQNWSYPNWNSGDYVQLVDTGQTFGGGQPNLALIQYSSNGTQKQVIAASGYVESIGDGGILYTGTTGNTGYYISNAVGLANYGGNYSYLVTSANPNRSQMGNYVVTTTPLAGGQVVASKDTITVQATDAFGGSTTTTIIVPILP